MNEKFDQQINKILNFIVSNLTLAQTNKSIKTNVTLRVKISDFDLKTKFLNIPVFLQLRPLFKNVEQSHQKMSPSDKNFSLFLASRHKDFKRLSGDDKTKTSSTSIKK